MIAEWRMFHLVRVYAYECTGRLSAAKIVYQKLALQ